MKKGDCITAKQLESKGFKHLLNYGSWQIWAKRDIRIYVEPLFGKISQIFDKGESRSEVNDEEAD